MPNKNRRHAFAFEDVAYLTNKETIDLIRPMHRMLHEDGIEEMREAIFALIRVRVAQGMIVPMNGAFESIAQS